ncbi:hypothetical protein WU87_00945 [Corynebacterium minutissimum]|uniref:Uncharacterized protein n=1 Tax=Corynebacterium minutissimum TaxID=38301 RepID=A0ACC4UDL4_9CORY|nr:hypothetical protein [Corynebacterium sp. Marseille-Q2823]KKO81309.1 hypothetical protein WU87_00945 [Corynebacterium minutissimum]
MKYHSDPHHVCYIFEGLAQEGSGPLFENQASFNLRYLNGIYYSPERWIISEGTTEQPTGVPYSEAERSAGEWLGVYTDSLGHGVIQSDPFGYQPVYYRFLPQQQCLLVSTSLGAITRSAQKRGAAPEPDWIQALAAIGTTHAWAITMQSDQTFEANTKVLLPGQSIQYAGTQWYVSQPALFEPKESYDELLQRGIQKAIGQLRIASTIPTTQKQINLSGGKDSRMVLALLAETGVIEEFSVTTMNPKTWLPKSSRPLLYKDLYLANYLRKNFSLEWTVPLGQKYVPMDFESAMSEWQSYRSNRNFKLRINRNLYVQQGTNIELRGAAGETFRGFNAVQNLLSTNGFENSESSLIADTRKLVDKLYGSGFVEPDHLDVLSQNLNALFNRLSAKGIQDALHKRYTVFRNGSHFGHARHSLSHGQIPILPLSQPEFVQAAQMLPYDQMHNGKVAFDIIESLRPELNEINFDGGFWDEALLPAVRRKNQVSFAEDSQNLEQFFKLDQEAIESRLAAKAAFEEDSHGSPVYEPRVEILNRIKQTLFQLGDFGASASRHFNRYRLNILQGLESRKLTPGPTLGKLDSMLEALTGKEAAAEIVLNSTSSASIEHFRGRIDLSDFQLTTTTLHPKFQVPVQTSDNQVKADVRVSGTLHRPLEFKFTLLENDRPIAETEYSASQSATFSRPTADSRVRVRVFARYASAPQVIFKFYSRYL